MRCKKETKISSTATPIQQTITLITYLLALETQHCLSEYDESVLKDEFNAAIATNELLNVIPSAKA